MLMDGTWDSQAGQLVFEEIRTCRIRSDALASANQVVKVS